MRFVAFVLLAVSLQPTAAFASDNPRELIFEKELEGSLATTAEGTSGSVDTSSQTGRAALDTGADLKLTVPELHMGDPWLMPVIGIGGSVDSELIGVLCDGCDSDKSIDVRGDAEVRVHATWATGFYRETYQRPVQFSDGFWRNERSTIRRTIGVHVDGLAFKDEMYDCAMFPFDWERRELFQAELSNYFEPERRLGDEHHFSVALGRVMVFDGDNAYGVKLLDVSFGHYVVPPPRMETDTGAFPLYMTPPDGSIQAFELDVTGIELKITGGDGTFGGRAGMTSRRPASTEGFADPETSGHVGYALGYGRSLSRDFQPGWERFGDRTPRHRSIGWLVQLEDFHRIDSTGLAADAGHQLGVDVAWGPIEPLTLSSRAAVIGARRKVISPLRAPEAELLAEVGDWIIMGRLEAQVDWEFHPMMSLTANAWLERSDRADPFRPDVHLAVIPLDTTAGAWVGLAFHPFN